MKKIYATGHEHAIPEDRPTVYVSHGAGNIPGEPEVHLLMTDPTDDTMVQFWVRRDALLAAILEPEVTA